MSSPPPPHQKKRKKKENLSKFHFPVASSLSRNTEIEIAARREGALAKLIGILGWHGSFLRENETVRLICELQGTDWHAFNSKLQNGFVKIRRNVMQREFIRECLFFPIKNIFERAKFSIFNPFSSQREDITMRILWKSALDRGAMDVKFLLVLWNRNTWRNWNESCLFSRETKQTPFQKFLK